jgi:hypothetical protein
MGQEGEGTIADLHMLFPIRARLLAIHLKEANAEEKKLEEWRERQIVNFIEMLMLNALDLERAYVEKRASTLAYVARNLLELSIWVEYCNLSDSNAKWFSDDVTRDLFGLSRALQGIGVLATGTEDPGLKKAQDRLVKFADSTLGIKNLDDDFKRVVQAAQELSREKSFIALNKTFSKLAHPTAWAVNSVLSVDMNNYFCELFLLEGVVLAMSTITQIREVILKKFPAPPNTPIS